MKAKTGLVVLAALVACGVSPESPDASLPDGGSDVVQDSPAESPDVLADGVDDADASPADAPEDPDGQGIETDLGPDLPCDCTDHGCVVDAYGHACPISCVDSCDDPAYRCTLVLVGGEPGYYCIWRFANLCRPCRTNADCKIDNGTDTDLCVDQGPDGSFCGADCSALPCPDGYFCQTVSIPDGGTSKQCFPSETTCECTDRFIEMQATTTCFRENSAGTCLGSRHCAEYGLSACDAQKPRYEDCNGKDDDCDGQTDEDLDGSACDVVNMWGNCPGLFRCTDGVGKCEGPEADKETCDGLDNNCDGKTDEGFGEDLDGDGIIDACEGDGDDDMDGVQDWHDNCPKVYNPDQANWDEDDLRGVLGDSLGDACDPDDDNDGWADDVDCAPKDNLVYPGALELCNHVDDNCDGATDEGFAENPFCGGCLPPGYEPDYDGDGILDELDNCPCVYNPTQVDADGDGIGDACDGN
jgi:hypothetical protein